MNSQTHHRSDALEPQEGPPKSWQDRDASQNQRQLGLDGVTPPAAHCPRRLPPGQNQGGTSLVFFFLPFLLFYSKGEGSEFCFLFFFSDCPPLFRPPTPPTFPPSPVAAFIFFFIFYLRQPRKKNEGFLFLGVWKLIGPFFLFDIPSGFN